MANNECKGCAYYGRLCGGSAWQMGVKCCHYMLTTGKRRVVVDGVCQSYAKKRAKKVAVAAWTGD